MKKIITLIAISILSAGLLAVGLSTDKEILIQSLESRTLENKPVYNKIKYFRQAGKEIWMMNQSHFGLKASPDQWERLAIVVDENKKASFYQLPPGDLVWSEELIQKQKNYRVSCFMCHNNGPRAIRPELNGLKVSWADQVKILFYNLKIKSYGRVTESDEMKTADDKRKIPFRHRTDFDNEALTIETCMKCHKEEGLFVRGALSRQQVGTIEFMVQNKIMPPPGFSLSVNEEKQLNDFIQGY